VRAATHTPVEPQDALLVSSPATTAFPMVVAGRLPRQRFRGLLGVHYALQPARPADSLMEPCLGVLQPIRHLLVRSKCFRLGRASPVGIPTRGFNMPSQGTHYQAALRPIPDREAVDTTRPKADTCLPLPVLRPSPTALRSPLTAYRLSLTGASGSYASRGLAALRFPLRAAQPPQPSPICPLRYRVSSVDRPLSGLYNA
jgi:hypothetical protein